MRKALPPHAKISDEAKFAIQESVTEFISFVTEEANQRCRNEQRKTITGDDILCSMDKLGFDNYVDPLTRYLQKYREMEGLNHPRRQLLFRPSSTTQHMGGLMPGPTVMVPTTMLPNPNTNAIMFAERGSSSSAPPPTYNVPSIPIASEGSCSSLINRINFDAASCSTHDEVEFDSIELPADASPSGSTSIDFMAAEDECFDPFAQFK
ncbi:hypothetical protein RND81_09G064900 [Saponaria officinalis]|uniref:Transcription factor CBF/NF-Y/archaeal histone domain-containing protein n=1 Tax=Saponaria officinalis TaxID=3572 RepID=A0AAW1IIL5_SAPOF